jgi:hypothetical protein
VNPQRPADAPRPSRREWREAIAVVLWPPHLKSTVMTAPVVGTILFAINQLNVVNEGHGTVVVWVKQA